MSMFLLLPPSEGKAPGGTPAGGPDNFSKPLKAKRAAVLDGIKHLLQNKDADSLAKILGVRGENLARAVDAYQAMLAGHHLVLPAWQRYTGVVWSALEPATLSEQRRGQILIPSALYGITTGLDQIADYRLTFKVALPKIGNLSKFWKYELDDVLLGCGTDVTIVDLLPVEHASVLDFGMLAEHAHVIRVEFVKADGGGAAGHRAKAVKGLVARHLLDEGIEALGKFKVSGWRVRNIGDTIQIVEV